MLLEMQNTPAQISNARTYRIQANVMGKRIKKRKFNKPRQMIYIFPVIAAFITYLPYVSPCRRLHYAKSSPALDHLSQLCKYLSRQRQTHTQISPGRFCFRHNFVISTFKGKKAPAARLPARPAAGQDIVRQQIYRESETRQNEGRFRLALRDEREIDLVSPT